MLATKDVMLNKDNIELLNALNLQVNIVNTVERISPRHDSLASWVGVDYQLSSTIDQNQLIEGVVSSHLKSINESTCWIAVVADKTSDGETFYKTLDSKQRPYSDVDGFLYLSGSTMADLSAEGYSFKDTCDVLESEVAAYNEWLLTKNLVIKTKQKACAGVALVMNHNDVDTAFEKALIDFKKSVNSRKDALSMTIKFDNDAYTPTNVVEAIDRLTNSLALLYSMKLVFGDFDYNKATKSLDVSFAVLEMPTIKALLDEPLSRTELLNALRRNGTFLENSKGLKKPNEWALLSMVFNSKSFKDLSEYVGLALMYSLLESLDYIDVSDIKYVNK